MDLDENDNAPLPRFGPFKEMRRKYRQWMWRRIASRPDIYPAMTCRGCGGRVFAATNEGLRRRADDAGWDRRVKLCRDCLTEK